MPSRILKLHNLEMLISSLDSHKVVATSESTERSSNSPLVPEFKTSSPTDPPVPYPVHKTLMLGDGLDGAIAFGRFSSSGVGEMGDLVKAAVNLSVPLKEQDQGGENSSVAIDMDIGANALATFRESVENSLSYEHGWFNSGLPALSTWLSHDLQPSEPMKPVLKTMISSITSDVESKMAKEEAARLQSLASIPTEHDITTATLAHLESWAEKSHAELRDQLDEAFSATKWHKLAWWKLLWRVDDVTMITSETLEQHWLVSAEKSSVYLAGRMNQAGFPDEVQKLAIVEELETVSHDAVPIAEPTQTHLSTEVRTPRPWPEYISAARTELIADTVPALQALAQRLLLQTFSTTSISTALSALLYVTASSVSVFEASTIAALGLTFSLRKMQKLWEGSRESWQGTVREVGRRTLKDTEETVRLIIRRHSGRPISEDAEALQRKQATGAVKRVREALEKLG